VTEQSAQGFFICPVLERGVRNLKPDNKFVTEAIMEIEGLEIVRVELKYCERCGGLWLRIWGTEDVYCPPCTEEMLDLPISRKGRKPRLPVNDQVDPEGEYEDWSGVYGEGGNA
jgi:hypothetical protein